MTEQVKVSDRRMMSGWLAWGILSVAVVVALSLFGLVGRSRYGDAGLLAAVAAAGICWVSTSVALFLATRVKSGPGAMAGLLAGMLIRMGVPLAAGVVLSAQVAWLGASGFMGQILGFYLITLAVETVLLVRLVSASAGKLGVL